MRLLTIWPDRSSSVAPSVGTILPLAELTELERALVTMLALGLAARAALLLQPLESADAASKCQRVSGSVCSNSLCVGAGDASRCTPFGMRW